MCKYDDNFDKENYNDHINITIIVQSITISL